MMELEYIWNNVEEMLFSAKHKWYLVYEYKEKENM